MELLYLPLTLYVFFIGSIRTGKLFYFSAANPKVPLGGFANDPKSSILDNIPAELKPNTLFISKDDKEAELLKKVQTGKFSFPVFVKPNIGEGGFLVKKLKTTNELLNYHLDHSLDYLLQEFIDYPIELSILIHNADNRFTISSITERQHLTLVGDGHSTVSKLLSNLDYSKYRLKKIKSLCQEQLNQVLEKGQKFKPTNLGNLDYGAKYIERSEIINSNLTQTFEEINRKVGLFCYARYDVMCTSMDDFLKGKMKILEVNGVKGEPIHIYDRKYSLLQAYVEIFKHWEFILNISKRNIKQGFDCPGYLDGFGMIYKHWKTKKQSLVKRGSI